MKKRILALALAGTTAFSVFGAAISANAATSTDVDLKVDAYMSYTPVAIKIDVQKATTTDTTYIIDENDSNGDGAPDVVQLGKGETVSDYIYRTYDIQEEYTAGTRYELTSTPENVLNNSGRYKPVDLYSVVATKDNNTPNKNKTYIRTMPINDTNWQSQKLAGTFYIDASYTLDQDHGYLKNETVYYSSISETDKKLIDAAEKTANEFNSAKLPKTQTATVNVQANGTVSGLAITKTDSGYSYTAKDGKTVLTAATLTDLIAKINNQDYGTQKSQKWYFKNDKAVSTSDDDMSEAAWKALKPYGQIFANISTTTSSDPDKSASIIVSDRAGKTYDSIPDTAGNMAYKQWTFNGDMTGETTVSPYKVTTSVNYGTGAMTVTKTPTPTIYAYDFLYTSANAGSASVIANNWNNGTLADAAKAIGTSELKVQTGRGLDGYGIRYETIVNWETFLNELSIYQDGHYYSIKTLDEFKSIYTDRYYADPVYDSATGALVGSTNVDLYNIGGLLTDIWNLRTPSAYENANTSQMIYLMQQYDKYIGDYIDQEEVSTDEWGDLLVSLLNSVTADDFKTALDYKRYTAKVDTLVADYENALTAGQVKAAEQAMYDMLTSSAVPYYASKTADKAALAATIDGLYFNVKTAPTQYSVGLSTVGNAEFTNYNYYVSVAEFDKTSNAYVFSGKMTQGYYSLYPMQDYIDNTGAKNAVYTGNATETVYADAKATDEYEWFWNVYQLAANMKKSNKFQGSVDAVNDALNEAVADLSATTTPTGTDTAALTDTMDKYADKIDTDYNKDYYDNYTAAIAYANDNAEGKWQTRIATMINGVAGEALTYQGTQVTVTKNDMKTVEEAIKNGETALKAIKEDANYNAAQVNALNKAIDQAQYLVDLYEGTYSTNKNYQSVNKQYTYLTGDKDQMVKSDLTKAIEAIDAAINYSEIVMGWSQNDAGKWMYGTEEGYLNDGWHQVDGGKTWFYFNADGTAKQSEWWNDNGTWYWFNSNCGAATGWAKVDGEWYFFKGNNAMKTGWEKVDGNWYYMASSGKMVTGWCEVNGKWYYFSKESNSLGQMLYSTTVDGYKLGADGAWIK